MKSWIHFGTSQREWAAYLTQGIRGPVMAYSVRRIGRRRFQISTAPLVGGLDVRPPKKLRRVFGRQLRLMQRLGAVVSGHTYAQIIDY